MTEYLTPASLAEALRLLLESDGEARVIAGGTDVMADLRQARIAPRRLVDITRVPGLDRIEVGEDWVKVGAAVTFAALKASPFVRRQVPALSDAAGSVGALALQNAATWVGNIVQAMPAADGAVVALALEAEARLLDSQGGSWQPVEGLFRGPGLSRIDPTRQIVSHLRFPRPRPGWGTGWGRLGRRPSLVLPILNCAVKLCLDGAGERIAGATIALGPVAPRPFRVRAAEGFLVGRPATTQAFDQAARLAQEAANPRSSPMRASREYRLAVLPSLVGDALRLAAERALASNESS